MTPENRYPASNGSVKWRFPPVHPEGRKFAAIAAAIAVLAWLFVPWLTWPLIILTGWVLAFFRDPVRVTTRDENLKIGRAHVGTPVTSAQLACRHLVENKT